LHAPVNLLEVSSTDPKYQKLQLAQATMLMHVNVSSPCQQCPLALRCGFHKKLPVSRPPRHHNHNIHHLMKHSAEIKILRIVEQTLEQLMM
jgi:hypothetical protein